ncbi:MAG: MFS transporter [Acidimicrobiales bacterium]
MRSSDSPSFKEKALSSASQAGLVNNLNDGLAWGLLPLYFADAGLSVARIGILAACSTRWCGASGNLVTGGLSDRAGRKPLIAGGMLVQAAAGLFAATEGFAIWAVAPVLIGVGTAMVYPTLLATIGDVAHPSWRARSVGIYRLWRDGGFAVGALLAGVFADAPRHPRCDLGCRRFTATSGIVVMVRMYETHPRHDRTLVPVDVDLES